MHYDRQSLDRFVNPRSIAIIGAGDDPLKINGRSLMFMLRHRCSARLLPVNPNRDVVQGAECYRHIADLPEVPDVAMIIVAKHLVPEIIDQLGGLGCPFAIVTSAGYAERSEAGRQHQGALVEQARRYGMRILGPNCLGMINLQGPIIMSWCATLEREPGDLLSGDVGLISQSGALLGSIWDMAMGHGLGYSCLLSTGNEADLEAADFIDYFARDEGTRVITAFIESLKDSQKFLAAVDLAHEYGKPLVVYKVGRTAAGARAAASHTGALTGSDLTFDAMCRAHGIVRVNSLKTLITTALVLRSQPPARGVRLGVFSCSGGAAGIISDQIQAKGLILAPVTREFEKDITAILNWEPPHNPLDIAKGPLKSFDVMTAAMRRFVQEESIDQVVILMTMMYFQKIAPRLMLAGLQDNPGKPVLGCWLGDKIAAIPSREMIAGGIPTFSEVEPCLEAARALALLGRYREKRAKGYASLEPPPSGAREQAMAILQSCGRRPNEAAAKTILSGYGLQVPRGKTAENLEAALQAAADIGFPVVVKGLCPGVPHKTEIGAVCVGIENEQDLIGGFNRVAAAVRGHKGRDGPVELLIEEMLPEPLAEVIIGCSMEEPGFPVVLFGLGGIWVEALGDVSVRLAPVVHEEAVEMIGEIRGGKILEGLRGKPPADKAALARALVCLSNMAQDLKDQIKEVDINPLMVYQEGVFVADALIRPLA
jgi:acyl-CoA synthetase (NDP forming)